MVKMQNKKVCFESLSAFSRHDGITSFPLFYSPKRKMACAKLQMYLAPTSEHYTNICQLISNLLDQGHIIFGNLIEITLKKLTNENIAFSIL